MATQIDGYTAFIDTGDRTLQPVRSPEDYYLKQMAEKEVKLLAKILEEQLINIAMYGTSAPEPERKQHKLAPGATGVCSLIDMRAV